MILMLMLKMIANVESGPIPEAFKPEFLTLIDGTISLPLNIPGTHYYNGLKARENIISIIRRMIKERRACPSSQPDMLDSLLQIEDSNHKKISDENIIDQVITIIHSGYETVSTTTMMIIKYLHDHPKALQDLREEHLAIREQKQSSTDPINWEEYKTMRFTRAVIFETLRLAAVTNGGMRKTTRDMELNGYVVPKGWRIYLYTRELYHDPILYPEPLSFNPWRWTKDTNLEGHKYFMLFGRGGRLCAGKELAFVVISIFLHYFVTKFRWEEIGECKLVEFPKVRAPNGLFIRVSNY
ncbi:hypothetical protein Scep_021216 [Stephania cephalantha]|uniref:Cytochrome P450 85A n=1 Tax=Stephania cephalantha TaxID=152367 RepID=A0AAP0F8K9_9MAGN